MHEKNHNHNSGDNSEDAREISWRDRAITEIFGAFDSDSNEATLAAYHIRQQFPGAALLSFHTERKRLLEWLSEMPDFRNLLSGASLTCEYSNLEKILPWAHWIGATFEGQEIEVVLPPSFGREAQSIVFADDEATVRALVAAASEYLLRPAGAQPALFGRLGTGEGNRRRNRQSDVGRHRAARIANGRFARSHRGLFRAPRSL